jgi:nitrate reductase gamma subunit
MNTLLWGVFPYVALTLFFVVPFIRMIYRPYGITTRASGMFNRDILGLASLCLHWGILLLFIGHLIGLFGGVLGSQTWVNVFFWVGFAGGVLAVIGSVLALLRRHMVPEVRALSQLDDYLVHYFLIAIMGIALYQALIDRIWGISFGAGAWWASLWRLQPEPELMASAGWLTQTHVFLALAFAAYFPFTKLIHMWTYPVNFFVRPYQAMRTTAQKFRRPWEFGLRSDKSYLTYTSLAVIGLFVGVGLFLRMPGTEEPATAPVAAAETPAPERTAQAVSFPAAGRQEQRAAVSQEQTGYPLYVSQCARCHGVNGDGIAPGMNSPRFGTLPRDLTAGQYRFVSTQSGVASDEDLRHVIVAGLPSSGMPGFPALSGAQVDSLVDYLDRIWVDRPDPGPAVDITPTPTFTAAMAEAGRQLYADNCAGCHGADGVPDPAFTLEDLPGHFIAPANLAAGEVKAGADPVELYFRIAAGIPNGDAPLMPAFSYLTPEEIWAMVAYLRRDILPPSATITAK